MQKYILDIEKLKSVTGFSQKEIASKLGVSETKITEAKTKASKSWGLLKKYNEHFKDQVPFEEILIEVGNEQ